MIAHISEVTRYGKRAIFVAGLSHVLGDIFRKFVRKKTAREGVYCLALLANNEPSVAQQETSTLQVTELAFSAIESSSDFWSEVMSILREVNQRPEKKEIIFENEKRMNSIKEKMKEYDTDFENLHLWAAMPALIYTSEIFKLEK
jgi:hypothetical protein